MMFTKEIRLGSNAKILKFTIIFLDVNVLLIKQILNLVALLFYGIASLLTRNCSVYL